MSTIKRLLACWRRYREPVYVVLEHATDCTDAVLHGVYTTREIAERVAEAIKQKKMFTCGYVCVLKKKIKGP